MSAAAAFARFVSCKYIYTAAIFVAFSSFSGAGYAEPLAPDGALGKGQLTAVPVMGDGDDAPTVGELRTHAATIADILEIAAERVEQLASTDAEKPALMEAIRHELSLSRRWNRHLGTILGEVAEARRALKDREREAAREIAHMTALAEEARLELMTLKKALTGDSEEEAEADEARSKSSLDLNDKTSIGHQVASSRIEEEPFTGLLDGPGRDLRDARETLTSIQNTQQSALRDVEAVRAKIIEALETLADAQGDLPIEARDDGTDLSSEDITGWAASMATKLNRNSTKPRD